MVDKLMYIPYDDTQNYPLCRLKFVDLSLGTRLNEPTNQNSIKAPKVVKPTNLLL